MPSLVHVLTLRSCDHVTFPGERDFAGAGRLWILRGKFPQVIRVHLKCGHKGPAGGEAGRSKETVADMTMVQGGTGVRDTVQKHGARASPITASVGLSLHSPSLGDGAGPFCC